MNRMAPRQIIDQIEANAALPAGNGDRFAGYAVMGLPFRSGHVLALRRFPVSSVGPGYTSVWHRDPNGTWTFYSTVNPGLACSRYFGRDIMYNVITPIDLEWTGPAQFHVNIGTILHWEVALTESLLSRLMNAAASLIRDDWWQRKSLLKAMGAAARFALGAGKVNLSGRTPNGHEFMANPQRVWLVDSSHAIINGLDLGPPGALTPQARLNEVLIPQRGLFAVARAFLRAPSQTLNTHPVLARAGNR
jgi:hypothetical protein